MKTLFCSQPFERSAGRLHQGHLRRFLTQDDAVRAGRTMRRHSAGVVVYLVRGNPDVDYWADPKVIAAFGEVPPEAKT